MEDVRMEIQTPENEAMRGEFEYWAPIEINGHQLNLELKIREKGNERLVLPMNREKDWLPSFGGYSIHSVECNGKTTFEVGFKKEDGKKMSYKTFDLNNLHLIAHKRISTKDANKLVNAPN